MSTPDDDQRSDGFDEFSGYGSDDPSGFTGHPHRHAGQPYGGQQFPDQLYPGQPYPGQQFPDQPYPGQPYPGQQFPDQSYADPTYSDPTLGMAPYGAPAYGMMQSYGPPAYGAMQPYGQYPPAERKDPALMLVASMLIPGLGTMLNGETGKGVAILGGYLLGALFSVILIGLPFLFGFWVWGMVDAYRGAQDHNRRHGLP